MQLFFPIENRQPKIDKRFPAACISLCHIFIVLTFYIVSLIICDSADYLTVFLRLSAAAATPAAPAARTAAQNTPISI